MTVAPRSTPWKYRADLVIALITLVWTALSVWLFVRELEGRAECTRSMRPGVVVEVTGKYTRAHWPTSTYGVVVIESDEGTRATVEVGGGSARLLPAGTTLDVCTRRGELDIAARRGGIFWTTAMIGSAGLLCALLIGSWAMRRDPWLAGAGLLFGAALPTAGWFALMLVDGITYFFASRPVGALDTASMDLPHVIAVPVGVLAAIVGFVTFLKDIRAPRGRPIWNRARFRRGLLRKR